ncbi:MAG TPA: c-type cytochrome [Thermoanaerobaculia bacterium]|jgi:cytochrome c2|nr:c-type cytochrome [Thermoanaerobaculia bacterium]
MKPQEPIPHNYSIRRLNLIFALSSIVLLGVTGLIVGYDYIRGWKWFQLEFLRMQQERIVQEMQSAKAAENAKQLADLDAQDQKGSIELAHHRDQYLSAQKLLDAEEGDHYRADQDYRFAKANLDAQRYIAEASVVQHRADAAQQQAEYDRQSKRLAELQLALQESTRKRDAAKANVDQWLKKIKDAEDQKKLLTASVDLLNKQLTAVDMDEFSTNWILSQPLLDFVNPVIKIDQVVLNDLSIDMNYMNVPRVDRCQTCHRAIDTPGWESKAEAARLSQELQQSLDAYQIPQEKRKETQDRIAQLKRIQDAPNDTLNPWRTHPKLDLYVGSASAHPLLEYGCTVCHRGQDRATEFGRAGHTPASPRMEHRWAGTAWWTLGFFPWTSDFKQRHWGYEENEFIETPMYPRHYYEAGCIKCHSAQMGVDRGEDITRATQTVELYGCYACHKINNWRFSDLRKPGPDLGGIAEKTTPEWAFRWISDPHNFRSTTRMPSFFYQRNIIDPSVVPPQERAQNIKLQDAEIHAIVSYLFDKSTHRVWSPPGAGDAARGKQIVGSVGCMGCHVDTEQVKDEKTGQLRLARRDDFPLERNYGFNFTGVGTKTNAAWIYNWVKNPKAYYAEAPMPSLRLTDQEASDVTAYLLTMQKPGFMNTPIRPADARAVHDLAKGYLINTLSDRDAEMKLRSMSSQEQLVYLGQRSIEKYGCYSCHNIKGFEGLKPIGTELTVEGSKALHLFDFGFMTDQQWKNEDGATEHVIHTVPSWVYNKLRNPRIYDDRRTKVYNDKLKMPNFHLTPEEARRIAMVVVGLTKEKVAENRMAGLDARTRLIEEGRKRVSQHNCRACHVVDGRGRAIASTIADANFLPPDLSPEGARAQSPFLFNFLKDPTVMKIRPWLSVRMPTFHFTDQEANTLVTFFAEAGKGEQFDTTRGMNPSPQNAAIGKQVFTMLRCAQCHVTTPVNPENPPVPNTADTTSLAPNLTLARLRLRHDWVPDWIRRPNEMIPGTRMPANFPRDAATGGFQSPLAMAIDSPQFAQFKATLLPLFGNNEKELKRSMGDVVTLTDYLRDYIWSIGITQMRPASPDGDVPAIAMPQPSLPPPAAPAAKSTRNQRAVPAASGPGR